MIRYWLTTLDNPFDPFTQFDDWNRFDVDHGYDTCQHLARIALTSLEMGERWIQKEINRAVKDIMYRFNFTGNEYKIVEKRFADGEDDENEDDSLDEDDLDEENYEFELVE